MPTAPGESEPRSRHRPRAIDGPPIGLAAAIHGPSPGQRIPILPHARKSDNRHYRRSADARARHEQRPARAKGSISFIETNNFAGFSFDSRRLDDLRDYSYHWNNAEMEFLDRDLDHLRAKLLGLIDEFIGDIALNTFPMNREHLATVPPEWEIDDPDRFFRVVNHLHETAAQIVDTHQALVRMARNRLCD